MKLYLKIFLVSMGLFFVAEVLVFGVFRHVGQEMIHDELTAYLEETVEVVRRMAGNCDIAVKADACTRRLVADLGILYRARVWIEDASGRALVKSFPDALPPRPPRSRLKDRGGYRYALLSGKPGGIFLQLLLDNEGEDARSLFMVHGRRKGVAHYHGGFIAGLALIGIFVALCLYPISRYITRSLKELTAAAGDVAGGDFSRRVRVRGKDELAGLSRSFNTMARQIGIMVRQGKEMAAHVSHELRSPLTRLRLSLEMLRDTLPRDGQKQDRLLDGIDGEIMQMDYRINQLLTMSRLDIPTARDEREDIALGELVAKAVEHFSLMASDREVGMELITGHGDLFCRGIAVKLVSVVHNLLDNAVRYTAPGGIISITLSGEDDLLRLTVANPSPPLDSEKLEAIFEPFTRFSDDDHGCGLGLVIVKKGVERHGGSVGVRWEEGKFLVDLWLPKDFPGADIS